MKFPEGSGREFPEGVEPPPGHYGCADCGRWILDESEVNETRKLAIQILVVLLREEFPEDMSLVEIAERSMANFSDEQWDVLRHLETESLKVLCPTGLHSYPVGGTQPCECTPVVPIPS